MSSRRMFLHMVVFTASFHACRLWHLQHWEKQAKDYCEDEKWKQHTRAHLSSLYEELLPENICFLLILLNGNSLTDTTGEQVLLWSSFFKNNSLFQWCLPWLFLCTCWVLICVCWLYSGMAMITQCSLPHVLGKCKEGFTDYLCSLETFWPMSMTVSVYAGLVFFFRKNSVLTPGVSPPSSFLDPSLKEWLRNGFSPPDPVHAHHRQLKQGCGQLPLPLFLWELCDS